MKMTTGYYKFPDGLVVLKRDDIPLHWYPFFMDQTCFVRYRVMILDFMQWNWHVEINMN